MKAKVVIRFILVVILPLLLINFWIIKPFSIYSETTEQIANKIDLSAGGYEYITKNFTLSDNTGLKGFILNDLLEKKLDSTYREICFYDNGSYISLDYTKHNFNWTLTFIQNNEIVVRNISSFGRQCFSVPTGNFTWIWKATGLINTNLDNDTHHKITSNPNTYSKIEPNVGGIIKVNIILLFALWALGLILIWVYNFIIEGRP